jgi:hypothetical protein
VYTLNQLGGRWRAILPNALCIHSSDPWPLPGHPEAMKMEPPPRLFSHQCLEGEFCEVWLSLYSSWESAEDSSSSTIFRPSIISKVKRTMPLSLPLCSK